MPNSDNCPLRGFMSDSINLTIGFSIKAGGVKALSVAGKRVWVREDNPTKFASIRTINFQIAKSSARQTRLTTGKFHRYVVLSRANLKSS
jgi:hypothetical protein